MTYLYILGDALGVRMGCSVCAVEASVTKTNSLYV